MNLENMKRVMLLSEKVEAYAKATNQQIRVSTQTELVLNGYETERGAIAQITEAKEMVVISTKSNNSHFYPTISIDVDQLEFVLNTLPLILNH